MIKDRNIEQFKESRKAIDYRTENEGNDTKCRPEEKGYPMREGLDFKFRENFHQINY